MNTAKQQILDAFTDLNETQRKAIFQTDGPP